MKMKRVDLDAIERAARAATPGPYVWGEIDYAHPGKLQPGEDSWLFGHGGALDAVENPMASANPNLAPGYGVNWSPRGMVLDYAGCGSHGCAASDADRAYLAMLDPETVLTLVELARRADENGLAYL